MLLPLRFSALGSAGEGGSALAHLSPAFALGVAISSGEFSKFLRFLVAQMLDAVVGAVLPLGKKALAGGFLRLVHL